MAYIEVKNKNGTKDKTPPAGYTSWLDFWQQKKGEKAGTCKAYGCSGDADVGGHVIKAGEGAKEYILPICYSHNNTSSDDIYKAWDANLISVK